MNLQESITLTQLNNDIALLTNKLKELRHIKAISTNPKVKVKNDRALDKKDLITFLSNEQLLVVIKKYNNIHISLKYRGQDDKIVISVSLPYTEEQKSILGVIK